MASTFPFTAIAVCTDGTTPLDSKFTRRLTYDQIVRQEDHHATLAAWHKSRKDAPHQIHFTCGECSRKIVLRYYSGDQDKPGEYEFACHPGVRHRCDRFESADSATRTVDFERDLHAPAARDFGKIILRIKCDMAPALPPRTDRPTRGSRTDRTRTETSGLFGLLTSMLEGAGTCIHDPEASGTGFHEIMPKVFRFTSENESFARKFGPKVVIPSEIPMNELQRQLKSACASTTPRHKAFKDGCIVVGVIRRVVPCPERPENVLVQLSRTSPLLEMSRVAYSASVKSYHDHARPWAGFPNRTEAIMIAIVSLANDRLVIKMAAWCHVDKHGMICESGYEQEAFALLYEHRVAFKKLVVLRIACGTNKVRTDLLAYAKGLSTQLVEIDPGDSADSPQKQSRDRIYAEGNRKVVSWVVMLSGNALPPELLPYVNAFA